MTVRLSAQVNRLLGIGTFALFLGVVFERAELALVALPLLLAIFVGLVVARSARYRIASEVSAHRFFEGDCLRVTITITAESPVALIEVLDPQPLSLEPISGNHHAAFSLDAGQTVRWAYVCRCVRRDRFELGNLHVRLSGRSGLLIREVRHSAPKSCTVYPRVVPLRRMLLPPFTQVYVGNYVSSRLGEGIEFGNIRPFAPGDLMRRINWRASLRQGGLCVNEYQQERNADVILMIDSLASVGASSLNTLDLSVRAAASLAWSFIHRKDRVGLIEYGGMLRWLRPGAGRGHLQAILDHLLKAEVTFSYVTRDLGLVPKRILPPRALVLAISPLLDARFVSALQDLLARAFPVVLLTVSPEDVTRAVLNPSATTDIACRLWTLERRSRIEKLRRQGITTLAWHPETPLEVVFAAAAASIRRKRRVSG